MLTHLLKKDFEVKINKESILYLDKKNQFKFKDKQNIDSSSIAIAIRSFLSLGFKISENQIQKLWILFLLKEDVKLSQKILISC